MERTSFLERCQTEKLRYDLCLQLRLFDYHCTMDKYGWIKCEKKKEEKTSQKEFVKQVEHGKTK